MKRIVLLKSTLDRLGGAEKYTWRLARAFQEKGAAVTLLTSGNVTNPSFDLFSYKATPPLSFLKVKGYDRFCCEKLGILKPDVIFGLDRNSFQTHLRASNGVHAAYLQKRREQEGMWKGISLALNPLHKTLLKLEKQAFEHPDLQVLFTNSHMVKEEILQHYSTDPQKIQVVHNGVEWTEMGVPFAEKREPDSRFHFLFIGNNYRRKGLENLLRGMALLPERDVHLSVLGKDKNIPFFQALARRLNLESQVSFLGQKADIHTFYRQADALVIPSFYDPFANVTVEALAMGLFVVSSKHNGGHEVLTEDTGAIIDNLDSPDSVAKALSIALRRPKTPESALTIRNSIAHLDFSSQMQQFLERTLA